MTSPQMPAAAGAAPVSTAAGEAAKSVGSPASDLFGVLLGMFAPAAVTGTAVTRTTPPAPTHATETDAPESVPGEVGLPLPFLASLAPEIAPLQKEMSPELMGSPAATTGIAADAAAPPASSLAAALPTSVPHGSGDTTPVQMDLSVAPRGPASASAPVAPDDAAARFEVLAQQAPAQASSSPAGSDRAAAGVDVLRSIDQGAQAPSGLEAAARFTTRIEGTTTQAGHATGNVVRTVHVAVGDPRWPGQLGHEVRLLVERGVQSATLRVNPEHLGPVEVRIDVVHDKANVQFAAAQPETRQALSDAMPRLRDMLADAGVALGDATVRQEGGQGGFTQSAPRPVGTHVGEPRHEAETDSAESRGAMVRVGLVDAYA